MQQPVGVGPPAVLADSVLDIIMSYASFAHR